MFYFTTTVDSPIDCTCLSSFQTESLLFLDIETTGFSPENSYIYLIGVICVKDSQKKLHQWFLEDISEEKELIHSFLLFAADYKTIIHYNGTMFDLPYIQKKCEKYQLSFSLFCTQIDLYRQFAPYKQLLALSNLKQKTLETRIGFSRKDLFSGGELIPIYTEFLGRYRYERLKYHISLKNAALMQDTRNKIIYKFSIDRKIKKILKSPKIKRESRKEMIGRIKGRKPDAQLSLTPDFSETGLRQFSKASAKTLLHTLLLHNQEDVFGLTYIAAAYIKLSLLKDASSWILTSIPNVKQDDAAVFYQTCTGFCTLFPEGFRYILPIPLKNNSSNLNDDKTTSEISIRSDSPGVLTLYIPLYAGTLKYFFEDYKNYFYLPLEDQAIHKSIAEFVDKKFRKRATKETCYQKKDSIFLPQPKEFFLPAFRLSFKDTFCYFEPSEEFWRDNSALQTWLNALLSWIFPEK